MTARSIPNSDARDDAGAAPPALTSDRLASPHAFFTRAGGVSTGLYASLQCGFGADDDPAAVRENRARCARALGAGPEALYTLHQTHSIEVVTLAAEAPLRRWGPAEAPKADALVTNRADVVLGALHADCAPCLLEDAAAGVVGAAHAGWRGALDGILGATVAAMEALGADRGRIRVAIGPTIGPAAYEVGPEFSERFLAADPGHRRFFSHPDAEGRTRFDLPAFLIADSARLGLADAVWIGVCTATDAERCFSYRRSRLRDEPDYGRMMSAIRRTAEGPRA